MTEKLFYEYTSLKCKLKLTQLAERESIPSLKVRKLQTDTIYNFLRPHIFNTTLVLGKIFAMKSLMALILGALKLFIYLKMCQKISGDLLLWR